MLRVRHRPKEPYFAGFDPDPTDGLFFAIVPDAPAARCAEDMAEFFHDACGLQGRPLGPDRFHVSLHALGSYVGVPNDVVRKACAAASTVAAAPFDIAFDCVESFDRKNGKPPLVLRSGGSLDPLNAFHRALGDAMARQGFRRIARSFRPHMTLLYDTRHVDARAVAPVAWTVREFVLIRSLLRRTIHVRLGRWPLIAAASSATGHASA
jgi:RNA 2',3'-cyclic 3'-phosphodiesterase